MDNGSTAYSTTASTTITTTTRVHTMMNPAAMQHPQGGLMLMNPGQALPGRMGPPPHMQQMPLNPAALAQLQQQQQQQQRMNAAGLMAGVPPPQQPPPSIAQIPPPMASGVPLPPQQQQLLPQGLPVVRPPLPVDVDPTFEDMRNMTTVDMATARFRTRHEYMNEIFDARSIKSIQASTEAIAKPDQEALQARIDKLEFEYDTIAAEYEDRISKAKERFEVIGRGEQVIESKTPSSPTPPVAAQPGIVAAEGSTSVEPVADTTVQLDAATSADLTQVPQPQGDDVTMG